MVKNTLPEGIDCVFIRQSDQLGLGHAVLCAKKLVDMEPFVVLLADDFITGGNSNATADLVAAYKRTGKNQLLVMDVPKTEVSNYGIVIPDETGKNVAGLVEKPNVEEAPSEKASIGRYVLTPEIFSILESISPGLNNEIQLADALNKLAEAGKVDGVNLKGVRFDCGSVDGFIQAINFEYSRR